MMANPNWMQKASNSTMRSTSHGHVSFAKKKAQPSQHGVCSLSSCYTKAGRQNQNHPNTFVIQTSKSSSQSSSRSGGLEMMMSGIGPQCVPPLINKRPGQTSATNHFDAWPQKFLSVTKPPRFHCPRLLTIKIPHHPQNIF